MYQQVIFVALFLVVIACLPLLTKWLVHRNVLGLKTIPSASRLLSAVAVGPSQRVVTVEVGPENNRTCLVLGVTAQQVTCLYRYSSTAGSPQSQFDESVRMVGSPQDTVS